MTETLRAMTGCGPIVDPRDAALMAHTPVMVVPRYGPLPLIDKPGHRYLVAEDGLWIEVMRPWLLFRGQIAAIDTEEYESLPFGGVDSTCEYAFESHRVSWLVERFAAYASDAMPNECAAWGIWDEQLRDLLYLPLAQTARGPGHVDVVRPALPTYQHLAVDLHSHAGGPAFFSDTDDADDKGEVKISIVVGGLAGKFCAAARLCVLDRFFEVEL